MTRNAHLKTARQGIEVLEPCRIDEGLGEPFPVHVAQPDPQWRRDNPAPGTSSAPYRVYNIGNSSPVKLTDYIAAIEKAVGKKAEINLLPLQPGDVERTVADTTDLARDVGFAPNTAVEDGIRRFVEWYREYYAV